MAVKTQNVQFRIYDRVSISNAPSGVTCKVAEIIHPDTTQANNGSGSLAWQNPIGTGYMALVSSPGISGNSPLGVNTTDTRHDHYLAMSFSPSSVGSKLFAGYISLEYL